MFRVWQSSQESEIMLGQTPITWKERKEVRSRGIEELGEERVKDKKLKEEV